MSAWRFWKVFMHVLCPYALCEMNHAGRANKQKHANHVARNGILAKSRWITLQGKECASHSQALFVGCLVYVLWKQTWLPFDDRLGTCVYITCILFIVYCILYNIVRILIVYCMLYVHIISHGLQFYPLFGSVVQRHWSQPTTMIYLVMHPTEALKDPSWHHNTFGTCHWTSTYHSTTARSSCREEYEGGWHLT